MMSWTSNSTCTPVVQSIPFSILDLKTQAVRLPVSKGSQILLSELLTWSGERGYCWWGIPAIAKDLLCSPTAVWRRATELKESGLLAVISRPGRSNYWVPLPGPAKMTRLQNELAPLAIPRALLEKKKEKDQKRCTVPTGTCTDETPPSPDPEPENVNAVEISPPEDSPLQGTLVNEPLDSPLETFSDPDASRPEPLKEKPAPSPTVPQPKTQPPLTSNHLLLVEEIERATGDTWSRGHFVNLVRQTDEQTIYAALSVTREKMALESGVNGGAYFTATLRGMMGLAGLGVNPSCGSITHQPLPRHVPTSPARPIPRPVHLVEPEPEPADPESLKKGWRMSYRSGGVSSLLSWIERCVPESLNVKKIWSDVRAALPGTKESFAVDRFLDTVVTRMKHAERMTEVRA